MFDVSRRMFLAGAAASGARFLGAVPGGEVHLRLGVLSDIHIFDERQVPVFERALAFFRDRTADGVQDEEPCQGNPSWLVGSGVWRWEAVTDKANGIHGQ